RAAGAGGAARAPADRGRDDRADLADPRPHGQRGDLGGAGRDRAPRGTCFAPAVPVDGRAGDRARDPPTGDEMTEPVTLSIAALRGAARTARTRARVPVALSGRPSRLAGDRPRAPDDPINVRAG